jgi:phenylacetate-CoA ligase
MHEIIYYLEATVFRILPVSMIQRRQLRKFARLFNHAKNNSAFYKKIYEDAGVLYLKINSFEDIKKIPVVTKEMMRAHDVGSILTTKPNPGLIIRSTSGSTGKPFDTYLTRKEYFTAYVRTYLSLKNYNPFKNFVLIGVFLQKEEIERRSFMYYLRKYFGLFRREAYSVYKPLDEIIQKLQGRKIHIISSTPSFLKILAEELALRQIKLNVKYAVTFGETLFPDVKEIIEKYLQAKIIDVYGCMELPTLAWKKPGEKTFSYPLNSLIPEYINPVEINGEIYGELVITNLVNHTMPFIRYKIGDLVKILDNDYKKMGEITGRIEDVIKLNTGQKIYRLQVWSIFRDFNDIEQYRIIQKRNGKIHFQAILKNKRDPEEVKAKILAAWMTYFHSESLEIEFLEELAINNSSGKFKNIEVEE